MDLIKPVWITDSVEGDLCTLSFESLQVHPDFMRLKISDNLFPKIPTTHHPLRHVVTLSILSEGDLLKIRDAINKRIER